ncbi:alpha/beta hydrolase [Actinomadura scrupuli]|uniref:alpha/beta hydrolase n=1 Tax=Actinomadura scrupuli TaxID=559629 RepID=UPI003D99C4AF
MRDLRGDHDMGLLDGSLLLLSIVLAIAAPVACLLMWNRISGPVALRYGGRLGLIAGCQVTALLLAGLLVNRSFQLYASWDDLFGAGGAGGSVQAAGPAGNPPVRGRLAVRSAGSRLRFRYDHGSQTYSATFTGRASGVRSLVRVWLPPEYGHSAYANARFPVIELFPGYPGTPSTWFNALHAGQRLREAMRRGQAKPYILVAPTITVQPGRDTECTDIPRGPQVATWLTTDIRQVMTENFRVLPGAESWATMGYSTGGFCAAKLAEQHPAMFRAGVSLAGYFAPASPDLTRDPVLARANNAYELLGTGPAVSLLLAGTAQDGDTVSLVTLMSKAARPPTQIFTYIVPRGGHNAHVWQEMLPKAYEWISERLVGPT